MGETEAWNDQLTPTKLKRGLVLELDYNPGIPEHSFCILLDNVSTEIHS